MAKIVLSDTAPSEAVHFVFGGAEFDLGGSKKKTYETDDADVLSNAEAHPWLTVQRDPVETIQGAYVDQIAPKDDPFAVEGQPIDPNDPDAARAAEAKKAADAGTLVAIEAGETQTEVVTAGPVAETLAADPDAKTDEKGS